MERGVSNEVGEGKEYVLGGSAAELERIEAMHESTVTYLGRLHSAPVDFGGEKKLRVLDSGTAGGRWLQDLFQQNGPNHEYVGTDITRSFFPGGDQLSSPHGLSPNGNGEEQHGRPARAWCKEIGYHIQDVKLPWPVSWHESFDLVHQRFVLGAVPKAELEKVITQLISLVKPGGWIEFMESDLPRPGHGEEMADDGKGDQDAAAPVWYLLRQLYLAMGSEPDLDGILGDMFRASGLVDIQETRVTIPVGVKRSSLSFPLMESSRAAAGAIGEGVGTFRAGETGGDVTVPPAAPQQDPRDVSQHEEQLLKSLQKRSMSAIATTGRHLAGAARMVPGGVEGFTTEELEILPDTLETRLRSEGGTYRVYSIWGRKAAIPA